MYIKKEGMSKLRPIGPHLYVASCQTCQESCSELLDLRWNVSLCLWTVMGKPSRGKMRNGWIVDAVVETECGSMSRIHTQTNMYKNAETLFINEKEKPNQVIHV